MAEPLAVLQQYWGYPGFRPLQEDIIRSVLDGRDTLALLPTGGGKSICFQVPSLCQEGICLVISPLIALMKDQVAQLRQRGIAAEAIYSGMHYSDIDRILDNCIYGEIKFLYLSPERLTTDLARERIRQMNVNLIAVDEAHCVSQWGYDFRPPYLNIVDIREVLPKVPVLALTATATGRVVTDIQDKLGFQKNNVFRKSFERPNLSYLVLEEENKAARILKILKRVSGSAIVYARSRRRTEELSAWLVKQQISSAFYHAGLTIDERDQRQEAWLNNKSRVMVATNAFGMGIDKADVRVVVHLDVPDSLEAYFQEAGRAGRDGAESFAVLLYQEGDRLKLEHFFEQSYPELKEVKRVYQALGSYFQLAVGAGTGRSFDFDLQEFAEKYQLNPVRVYNSLKILEQSGVLVLTDAVFVPSMLRIKVNKEAIYDYRLRNKKYDLILKTILRTYQGAFSQGVMMRETQLARFLKVPLYDLQTSLKNIQRDGVIEYRPQKDRPQLIFLVERLETADLAIDIPLYRFRKKRQLENIRSVVRYAEEPVCRSQQLLRYFGEKDPPRCGQCDVCRQQKSVELSNEEFIRFKSKIQLLLKRDQLTTEDVVESFATNQQPQVLKAISYLLDEGILETDGHHLQWTAKAP